MPDYTLPERQRVALITNELQRDYQDPESPLSTQCTRQAVREALALVSAFREQGLPILHGVRFFLPDGSNVEPCRRQAVEEGMRVLMPGTRGADLLPEILPADAPRLAVHSLLDGEPQEIGPREYVFYKPRWGAFHRTCLDALLQQWGITSLVLVGSDFDRGVHATVYEACARDYRVAVIPEASGNEESDRSLDELGRLGVYLMNLQATRNWLKNGMPPAQGAA
jgi:nicotinamidase-related amidase